MLTLPVGPWLEQIGRQVESSTGFSVHWVSQGSQPMALITVPDRLDVFGEHRSVRLDGIELRSGSVVVGGSTVTDDSSAQSFRESSVESSDPDGLTDRLKY